MLLKTGSGPTITTAAAKAAATNGQPQPQQRKTRHDQLRRANAIRSRSKSSVG